MNFKSIITLFSGSLLAQVITFASSPYLSRIYTPDDYGVWAIFSSMMNILVLVAGGRYELAIVLPAEDSEGKQIVRQTFVISVTLSVLMLAILVLTGTFWSHFFKIPEQRSLFVWVAVTTFFYSGSQILTYWNTRCKNFDLISKSRVVQSLATLGGTVAFAFGPLRSQGLILGTCLGQALGFLFLLRFFGFKDLISEQKFYDRELLARYKNFPLYSMPGALFDTISLSLPSMLTSKFFGIESAGQYAFAYRIISTPLSMIHMSVSQVFFQNFSRAIAQPKDHPAPKKIILQTWALMAAVIVVPLLVTFFAGPEVFSWIFGHKWHEAGAIASLLSPLFFFFFISAPTSPAYLPLGLQHFALFYGIWSVGYRSFAFWWGYQKGNFMFALKVFCAFEFFQLALHNSVLWIKLRKWMLLNPASEK